MAKDIKLALGQAAEPSGADPVAKVTIDPPLKPGIYTFSLVVTDDAKLESAPATLQVEVRNLPTAKLTGPLTVAPGRVIELKGEGSSASVANGKIVLYSWSVAGPNG